MKIARRPLLLCRSGMALGQRTNQRAKRATHICLSISCSMAAKTHRVIISNIPRKSARPTSTVPHGWTAPIISRPYQPRRWNPLCSLKVIAWAICSMPCQRKSLITRLASFRMKSVRVIISHLAWSVTRSQGHYSPLGTLIIIARSAALKTYRRLRSMI